MKSCTSRTVFFELLRITPLTLPSGWAATFSILRTLSACCCEKTVCANEGFDHKLLMKPNKRITSTISARIRFDKNVIIEISPFIWCLWKISYRAWFRFDPSMLPRASVHGSLFCHGRLLSVLPYLGFSVSRVPPRLLPTLPRLSALLFFLAVLCGFQSAAPCRSGHRFSVVPSLYHTTRRRMCLATAMQ